MSAFTTQLRANRAPIALAQGSGPGAFTFRVEASDIWDAVRVVARPETAIAEVKQRVVGDLFAQTRPEHDFVLKFRGWEILDENASLKEVGIGEGSIVLLAIRRRRPVR